MPRPATHKPRRIHSIRNEGCPTPGTSFDPTTSETTVPDETLIALLSAQRLRCKKQIPLFSTQNDEPDSQRFQRRAVILPTNPAPQNADAPQHRNLHISLQAQLQPVMMQKCITSFFSQEYCFPENLGLSASSGTLAAHSAPSELFDTGVEQTALKPPKPLILRRDSPHPLPSLANSTGVDRWKAYVAAGEKTHHRARVTLPGAILPEDPAAARCSFPRRRTTFGRGCGRPHR